MVVRKRDEDRAYTYLRQCGDYKPINGYTDLDRYPLLVIEDIFHELQGEVIFSKLDLRCGYHQVLVAEHDKCKTALWGMRRQL